jgi:hypothetical protein
LPFSRLFTENTDDFHQIQDAFQLICLITILAFTNTTSSRRKVVDAVNDVSRNPQAG